MAQNPFGAVGRAAGGGNKSNAKRSTRKKLAALPTVSRRNSSTSVRSSRQAQNRALVRRDTVGARGTIARRKKAGR